MEQSVESGDFSIRKLAGLNQRVSPLDIAENEFSVLQGYYPSQQGLLSRLPGKRKIFQLEGTILSIFPTYNSVGAVLIQTTEGLYLSSVDEIMDRIPTSALTPNPVPDPGGGGTVPVATEVIFYDRKATGVDGDLDGTVNPITGNVSSARRKFREQIIPIGTQSFVLSFTDISVTLAAGKYLLDVTCVHYSTIANTKFIHAVFANGYPIWSMATQALINTNVTTHSLQYLNFTSTGNLLIDSWSSVDSRLASTSYPLQGKAQNLSEQEYYTIVKLTKLP